MSKRVLTRINIEEYLRKHKKRITNKITVNGESCLYEEEILILNELKNG